MSALFSVHLLRKHDQRVELEVLQTHPDAGTWDSFLSFHFLQACALPAFGGDGWPPAATAPLAKALGSWDTMSDAGLAKVQEFFAVTTAVVKDVYNDGNVEARLAEAGLAGKPLTRDVVEKICGRLRVTLEAKDPRWVEHFVDGADWSVA